MRRPFLAVTGLLVAAGLLLGAPTAALAGPARSDRRPPASLETLRARCLGAIGTRITALGEASSKLAQVKGVTDAHRAALAALLTQATTALQALKDKIGADTDAATLAADCRSLFTDYRALALVLPRTRLVAAADETVAAADRLSKIADRLEAAITKAGTAGKDTTAAAAQLASMRAKIDSGRTGASAIADQILGLTPAAWNANHELLRPARQVLRSARVDLGAARDLGRKVIADLRP